MEGNDDRLAQLKAALDDYIDWADGEPDSEEAARQLLADGWVQLHNADRKAACDAIMVLGFPKLPLSVVETVDKVLAAAFREDSPPRDPPAPDFT